MMLDAARVVLVYVLAADGAGVGGLGFGRHGWHGARIVRYESRRRFRANFALKPLTLRKLWDFSRPHHFKTNALVNLSFLLFACYIFKKVGR